MKSEGIIDIIILLIWEFFTPVLADGFRLESEFQQVSYCLLDFSLYFGQSHSSTYLQDFQSLFQSFVDYTECTNYNWYHRHFHVP